MSMAGRTYRPLLLFLLHQTLIVTEYLERPQYLFPGRLPHPSHGSILGVIRFDNPDGIKHLYITVIILVAVDVPLIPVLAVIFIVLLEIISHIPVLFYFVIGSVTCVHFGPDATERLVQQKSCVWKSLFLWTIYAELVNLNFSLTH